MRLKIILLLGICLTASLAAPENAPDFAQGFKHLSALGLPTTGPEATWTRLRQNRGYPQSYDYELQEFTKSAKGNGWLLPADGENNAFLPIGAAGPEPLKASEAKKNKPADLEADISSIVQALQKHVAKRSEYDRPQAGVAGKLLILAAQVHQHGQSAQANELALAVFDYMKSREAAVDAAISILANDALQTASNAFFDSGDWAAYHRELAAITKKFPRGWDAREAVAMILTQLEKQAAGGTATPPSLDGIRLDPAALSAVKILEEKPPAASEQDQRRGEPNLYIPHLWLLSSAKQSPENPSVLTPIISLGIKSFPVLAALADDPFLTHFPNPRAFNNYRYYGSDEDDLERIRRRFDGMMRPMSRGEIARALLAAALPDPASDLDESEAATLRELALDFWKKHQNASPAELAAVFLAEGSAAQSNAAANHLAQSPDPQDAQAFETHVLASDPAIRHFQAVRTYLARRKATAKPFYDAYAKLVRTQTPEINDDNDPLEGTGMSTWEIRNQGGVEGVLKSLGGLVSGKSYRAIAKEIARGNPDNAGAAIASLVQSMKDAGPTKQLYALLEGALAADDSTVRLMFLGTTRRIRWAKSAEDESTPERKLPDSEARGWRKLLSDNRGIPESFSGYFSSFATVGDFAAYHLLFSVKRHHPDGVLESAPFLQISRSALLQEHAAACLSGKPLPPLPDANRVAEDRLREIVTAAGAKPAPEIHAYLATLSPDERAAWTKWWPKPDDLPVPKSVKDLATLTINRSDFAPASLPDMPGAGGIDVGFVLTSASFTKHIAALAADPAKHSRINLNLHSSDFGPGLSILAQRVPLPEPAKETDEKPKRRYNWQSLTGQAMAYLSAASDDLEKHPSTEAIVFTELYFTESAQSYWLLEKGKAVPADPDSAAKFLELLQSVSSSAEIQPFNLRILTLSKADAEAFLKSESND